MKCEIFKCATEDTERENVTFAASYDISGETQYEKCVMNCVLWNFEEYLSFSLLGACSLFSLNLNSRLQEEVGEGKIVYTDGIMPGNESKV